MVNNGKNLSIIIPAGGLGRRMKSYGPKSLITLDNGQTLLSRQLDILKSLYPKADFVLVVGHEADRVYKAAPSYVRVVENEYYDETNVVRSISLGLKAAIDPKKLLIVYGDLVFNKETFENQLENSHVIVDTKGQMLETEVGLFTTGNYVAQFAYNLPAKWAHIAYLSGKELQLFKQLVVNPKFKNLYGFELMNMIIGEGGRLKINEPENMQLTEIDTSKDLERANEMLKRKPNENTL